MADGTGAQYSTRITSQVLEVTLLFTETGTAPAFVATAQTLLTHAQLVIQIPYGETVTLLFLPHPVSLQKINPTSV